LYNLLTPTFSALWKQESPDKSNNDEKYSWSRFLSGETFQNLLPTCFSNFKFQLIVIMVILFKGADIFGIPDGSDVPLGAPPTQHFTIIFNAFVWMQIFNEINARKIHGERNVFQNFFTNPVFTGIVFGTAVTQVNTDYI